MKAPRLGRAGWCVSALLVLAGAPLPARGEPRAEERAASSQVPRLATPEEELAHARELKLAAFRARPRERAERRALAVQAYLAVLVHHPEARVPGAEAAFRAGELLRADGEGDRARKAFLRARELGEGTSFRARSGLELGHLARREAREEEALALYLEVASDAGTDASHRDEAWLWAGKTWAALGRGDDARRAWAAVARAGSDALDRVQAYDLIGLSWIEADDPEAAAGVLDECLSSLGEESREETRNGRRIREALFRMRVVGELRRIVKERVENGGRRPVENPVRR